MLYVLSLCIDFITYTRIMVRVGGKGGLWRHQPPISLLRCQMFKFIAAVLNVHI